jgi:DNA-binding transcriptional LysR family regulator
VELRQLRCFVAVAEERHFGRAATRLGIGQPAASQLIARLERELRIPLFARTSRRVALTPPGAEFLGHARDVLAAADAATAAAGRLSRSPRRLLVVGTCTGLGDRVGPILAALAESDPALDVRLQAVAARDRAHRVAGGQVAAAFTHEVRPHREVRAETLWLDPLRVALPAAHPLARKRVVHLSELSELPLRLVARRANPPLYDLVTRACVEAGFQPMLLPAASTLEDLMAELGSGPPSWTVIFAARARQFRTRTEVFRSFAAPGLALSTSLLVPAGPPSPDVAALLRACRSAGDRSAPDLPRRS